MSAMTIHQRTALARLIARDLSGAPMKIDCRSLDALKRRGLIRYKEQYHALSEKNTIVTGAGIAMVADDDTLDREVDLHLRLEHDRAWERAGSYEATARMLRRRAEKWSDALDVRA